MTVLDNDWILLISKAKQLGLTVEEIQKFLKLNQKEK
ncbi:DNA-binding anti-repressor SinI [Niallia circulans]|nr:DNA-binding anti-repressor SinI [Niallia circulans]QJX61011.1 DNA-binding anti-repressor SinI [Niallia circulans]